MKHWIINCCLMLPFLLNGFSGTASNDIFSFADSLYEAEEYRQAALEYEWIAYHLEKRDIENAALLKKAQCLKQLREFDEALYVVSRAIRNSVSDDSVKIELRKERIFLYYILRQYEASLLEFGNLTFHNGYMPDIGYLEVLNFLKMEDDSAFFEALDRYCETHKSEELYAEISSLYETVNIRAPASAIIPSIILPGSGAAIYGKPVHGAVSLGLTAGAAYYGYAAFQSNMYTTAFFTGLVLAVRFYMGNISFSKKTVKDKNNEVRAAFNRRVEGMILSFEKTYRSAEF